MEAVADGDRTGVLFLRDGHGSGTVSVVQSGQITFQLDLWSHRLGRGHIYFYPSVIGSDWIAVVSAAAGAVGSIAGQIAKIRNGRVVGIAGGKTKCDMLTADLGFDAGVDYKAGSIYLPCKPCPMGAWMYISTTLEPRYSVQHEQKGPDRRVRLGV